MNTSEKSANLEMKDKSQVVSQYAANEKSGLWYRF